MKCPYCDNGVSRYSAPGFRWPCTICNGTGEIVTNEEYFCKLPTEVKARVLVGMCNSRNPRKGMISEEQNQKEIEDMVTWLKEVHT